MVRTAEPFSAACQLKLGAQQNIEQSLVCAACKEKRDVQDLRLCKRCRPLDGPRPYYCEHFCSRSSCNHTLNCKLPNHQTCWYSHLPNNPELHEGHEPVRAFDDAVIRIITYSEADDVEQRKLHALDREAQWFTFNLAGTRYEEQEATLEISDRFRSLCDPGGGNAWTSQQYPSFVSFIGDTGVGKSTLVNAMITIGRIEGLNRAREERTDHRWSDQTLQNILQARRHGPVTRSGNPEHASLPTSSGVHLYRDPTITKVEYSRSTAGPDRVPILFVDCEGFRGGTTTTNSQQGRLRDLPDRSNLSGYFADAVLPIPRSPSIRTNASARTIRGVGMQEEYIQQAFTVHASDYKEAGKEGAELFYARFLYAFSDVIVFVTKEEQQLQNDMRRLLEWAASAVKKSKHHRPKKTLIIVRNMPQLLHTRNFYDRTYLKKSLLDSLGPVWVHSEVLAEFKRAHDRDSEYTQSEIHSNDDFIRIFFQEVQICYIPLSDKVPASELYHQYSELRNLIVDGTKAAQQVRSASWTRYDIPTMSDLLARAFDHFSQRNDPFDFYSAARKDNPTPISVPGHIANLLRHIQTSTNSLESFAKIVASCLISYVCRNFKRAEEPQDIFDNDLSKLCEQGIHLYQTKFQRCAYKFPDQDRCIVVGIVHPDHCNEKNVRHPGDFDSSEYRGKRTKTIDTIRVYFKKYYTDLFTQSTGQLSLRLQHSEKVSNLRQDVLGTERLRRSESLGSEDPVIGTSFWDQIKSNKTCFACLQSAPDHVLFCGHSLCDECMKDFGGGSDQQSKYRHTVSINHCVLCRHAIPDGDPYHVAKLKPRCAGLRLLALDGGGVRGIVEIALLEKLECRVGLDVPVRELFDLIVGTSTGGIIALGIAMTKHSISEMNEVFRSLATQTFQNDRRGMLSWIDPLKMTAKVLMFMKIWKSRYSTRPLRDALMTLFGQHQSIFSCPATTGRQRLVRVAVTSTSAGHACIFSNYSRAPLAPNRQQAIDEESDYLESEKDFEREDDPIREARIWEAALATSAAPGFFRKWKIGAKPFVDGALHSNLPAPFALQEMERIWPPRTSQPSKVLDTLVTVGTGIQNEDFHIPSWLDVASLGDVAKSFYDNTVDTEKTWQKFKETMGYAPDRQFRLNVEIKGDHVALDRYDQMPMLVDLVDREYHDPKSGLAVAIERAAYRLTASLLYFEPDPQSSADLSSHARSPVRPEEIRGQIWCRLARGSPQLKRLVHRIAGFWRREHVRNDREFVPHPWAQIRMPYNWKVGIVTRNEHFALPLVVWTRNPDAMQTIAIELHPPSLHEKARFAKLIDDHDNYTPISGFPVEFRQLQIKAYTG